jgi:hypothetical protein
MPTKASMILYCKNHPDTPLTEYVGETLKEAHKKAKDAGWLSHGVSDAICPECARKPR